MTSTEYLETLKKILDINPMILMLVFAVIFSLNFYDPLGSICIALSEYFCMVIGYCILSFFLTIIMTERQADILINSVLLVSIVLLFCKKVINLFYNDKCERQPLILEYNRKYIESKKY